MTPDDPKRPFDQDAESEGGETNGADSPEHYDPDHPDPAHEDIDAVTDDADDIGHEDEP